MTSLCDSCAHQAVCAGAWRVRAMQKAIDENTLPSFVRKWNLTVEDCKQYKNREAKSE